MVVVRPKQASLTPEQLLKELDKLEEQMGALREEIRMRRAELEAGMKARYALLSQRESSGLDPPFRGKVSEQIERLESKLSQISQEVGRFCAELEGLGKQHKELSQDWRIRQLKKIA